MLHWRFFAVFAGARSLGLFIMPYFAFAVPRVLPLAAAFFLIFPCAALLAAPARRHFLP
jgi:hypothetical protein